MQLLENLKWRYATKTFDSKKIVSQENILNIKRAIQLSASSYGLQLFKVLDIQSKDIRKQLQPASWGQSQIVDASHLFVFCNYIDLEDVYVDEYLDIKAKTQNISVDSLQNYGNFIKEKMKTVSIQDKQHWMAKQTYIALSSALIACAELGIDSTPMEGFQADFYDKILGLKAKHLQASVVLSIGYRSSEDSTQHDKKVRKPLDDIFEMV